MGQIELVSLKDVQGFEVNPFMVELQGRMYLQPRANTIIAKGQSIINTDTGELIDEAVLLGRRKIVDSSNIPFPPALKFLCAPGWGL